jgi:hypothetical protein
MGLRPIRPSIATQRDVDGPTAARSALEPSSGETTAAPVAARWGGDDALPDPVVSRSAGGAGTGLPTVQLSSFTPPAPAAPVPGAAMTAALPNEIVFPPRDAGGEVPSSALGVGPGATTPGSWSNSGPAAFAAEAPGSPAHRSVRPLTLARSVAGGSPATAAPQGGGGSGAPVIARIVADPSVPGAPPTVQTSTDGGAGGTPVAAITATPVVQRADGAAPPAPGTSEGHSDTELDDLARVLFGRIRTHLRAEVIHEREAKGLTFDAF